MTAPIGYPEQFGVLLDARRNEPKLGEALDPGRVGTTSAPGDSRAIVGPTFSEQVAQFVSSVDQTQKTGRTQAEEFAVGHSNDIHGTMIAVDQADISLRLLANVRNRAVDLYREVMRMGS
jgi:flagellar hook-basal body complex protein FliE